LSEQQLSNILPVLSAIGQRVGKGMTPDKKWLKTLLSKSTGGADSLTLQELEQWGKILTQVRTKVLSEAAGIQLLRDRGIPEAPAILAINHVLPEMLPFVVGICGRSCCGKGVVAEALASVNYNVLHINMDSFFKVNPQPTQQYKGYPNWDCTEALMIDSLVDFVKNLKLGRAVRLPSRGWTDVFDVEISPEELRKRNLILIEGFLLFAVNDLADLFDSKIFIDVSDLNILYRRLLRDKSMEKINYIYEVVIPMSNKHEQKQRTNADVIFDGNVKKDKIIANMTMYINDTLSKRKVGNSLNYFGKQPPWKVHFGALLTDHYWHPIDVDNLKSWVQERKNELESGQELVGNTFRYRKNRDSGIYELKLGTRNIYRYDWQLSPA
jgi:uridine kinase